jgi:hypothetical protein
MSNLHKNHIYNPKCFIILQVNLARVIYVDEGQRMIAHIAKKQQYELLTF